MLPGSLISVQDWPRSFWYCTEITRIGQECIRLAKKPLCRLGIHQIGWVATRIADIVLGSLISVKDRPRSHHIPREATRLADILPGSLISIQDWPRNHQNCTEITRMGLEVSWSAEKSLGWAKKSSDWPRSHLETPKNWLRRSLVGQKVSRSDKKQLGTPRS